MIYPLLRVVPMGWTLALQVCQELHETVAERVAAVRPDNRFYEKWLIPRMRPLIHTEYVDNFVGLSNGEESSREVACQVQSALQAAGLPTHDVVVGRGGATLGWFFSSTQPIVGASSRSVWRLRFGVEETLSRGRISGLNLSAIIGNFTHKAMIRMELLALLDETYRFIEVYGNHTAELWPSVRRELWWLRSLVHLAQRDLSAAWSKSVHVFDASWWGFGIMKKTCSEVCVRDLGQYNDRWRFTQQTEFDVSQHALVKPRDELESNFKSPEGNSSRRVLGVSASVWSGDWQRIASCPWKHSADQVILEGQACVMFTDIWLGVLTIMVSIMLFLEMPWPLFWL